MDASSQRKNMQPEIAANNLLANIERELDTYHSLLKTAERHSLLLPGEIKSGLGAIRAVKWALTSHRNGVMDIRQETNNKTVSDRLDELEDLLGRVRHIDRRKIADMTALHRQLLEQALDIILSLNERLYSFENDKDRASKMQIGVMLRAAHDHLIHGRTWHAVLSTIAAYRAFQNRHMQFHQDRLRR